MSYSQIIKNIRKDLNISQEDLARELRVSYATVNRWENEKANPSKMAKNSLLEFCKKNKIPGSISNELKQK